MTTYNIEVEATTTGKILRVGFGEPAQNDRIVRDADARLTELLESGQLRGGKLLKVNGPASLPVAFVIAHRLAHLFSAIAVFDPKLGNGDEDCYVVVISHHPDYPLGHILH
jgi:CRISPR-associated protein Csx3